MKFCVVFFIIICSQNVVGQLMYNAAYDTETQRTNIIVDIITQNYKYNGWSTIICCGTLPDEIFSKLSSTSHPFAIINIDSEDEDMEDVVHYYSNMVIISLQNIAEYEETISKVKSSPYWHPLANIILYYHDNDKSMVGKLFFSLWFHRAINAIIVQYDDSQEMLDISHYTPYTSDNYKLDHQYGCWTTRKIGMPVFGFDEGLTCEEECHNVTQHSKLKANNLGTCISYSTIRVPYNDTKILNSLDLFPDKAKNFYGYPMRSFATEIYPPFLVDELENGTYRLRARDGIMWNTLAKVMNFTIDLSPVKDVIKAPFDFEKSITQIFDFSHRKADLYLIPIYLFDLVIVEIDFSFPLRASGVCIMSHRAGFETTIFNSKSFQENINVIAQFIFCFISIWIIFSIYQAVERGRFSFDQFGKDLLNAIRNVLLITLYNPPRRYNSFRIFLTISIWSFFVLNFATQATIISFLTAVKRGKDVETFEDMIEKGYLIYGMASPDLILPEDEENFRIINSRLVAVRDLYGCVKNMSNDNQRFCLIDCAVGRFIAKNNLNEQGEQFLHIAQDRMHSHYLALLHIRNSPLTERFDKYLMSFFESGLMSKWEQYRYTDIKEEAQVKPLGMDDLTSLFNLYLFSIGAVSIIFVMELIIFHVSRVVKRCSLVKTKRRVD